MSQEYWLQKKTIGGWSMVTWYSDLEQAQANYSKCVGKGDSGYSWRLCEVKAVKEDMLNDVVNVEAPVIEQPLKAWGQSRPANILIQDAPKSSEAPVSRPWGQNATSINPGANGEVSKPDGRGAKPGSVCLMHHGLKKRCRAMPEELDMLLSQGWQRGGPRTQFEG